MKLPRISSQDDVDFEIVRVKYKPLLKQKSPMDEKFYTIIISKEQGVFQISNIPFYCCYLSYGDIIYAEFDEDENCFFFQEIIEASGFKSIPIIIKQRDFSIRTVVNTLSLITKIDYEIISDMEFSISIDKRDTYFNLLVKKIDQMEMEGILIRLDN